MNSTVLSPQRNLYIDAIKGVGIISIVLGHACWIVKIGGIELSIGPFVYLYHLAIFGICSGMVYKSNDESIWNYVGKRLKSMYKPFIIYSILYVLTRNIFIKMGVLAAEKYTFGELAINITNIVTFNGCGELMSALWFVPMLFFSLVIFAAIEKGSNVFFKNEKLLMAIQGVFVICVGVLGLYTTEKQFVMLYNMQISYLFVPIIFAGNVLKRSKLIRKWDVLFLGCSFFMMQYFLKLNIGIIELSKFMIVNKWIFYPLTLIGSLFCLSLTSVLCRSLKMERILAICGKYSFDIMALHFVCFKLLDFVLCNLFNKKELLSAFPHAFDSLWILYVICGVGVSIAIRKAYDVLSKFIRVNI